MLFKAGFLFVCFFFDFTTKLMESTAAKDCHKLNWVFSPVMFSIETGLNRKHPRPSVTKALSLKNGGKKLQQLFRSYNFGVRGLQICHSKSGQSSNRTTERAEVQLAFSQSLSSRFNSFRMT